MPRNVERGPSLRADNRHESETARKQKRNEKWDPDEYGPVALAGKIGELVSGYGGKYEGRVAHPYPMEDVERLVEMTSEASDDYEGVWIWIDNTQGYDQMRMVAMAADYRDQNGDKRRVYVRLNDDGEYEEVGEDVEELVRQNKRSTDLYGIKIDFPDKGLVRLGKWVDKALSEETVVGVAVPVAQMVCLRFPGRYARGRDFLGLERRSPASLRVVTAVVPISSGEGDGGNQFLIPMPSDDEGDETEEEQYMLEVLREAGFTDDAIEYYSDNWREHEMKFKVDWDKDRGGTWYPGNRTVETSNSKEAALHELVHMWWTDHGEGDPELRKAFVKDIIALAHLDENNCEEYGVNKEDLSKYREVIWLAKEYVYGRDEPTDPHYNPASPWPGMLATWEEGEGEQEGEYLKVRRPENIGKMSDEDYARANAHEMFAGMASFMMGNTDMVPEFVRQYYSELFKGGDASELAPHHTDYDYVLRKFGPHSQLDDEVFLSNFELNYEYLQTHPQVIAGMEKIKRDDPDLYEQMMRWDNWYRDLQALRADGEAIGLGGKKGKAMIAAIEARNWLLRGYASWAESEPDDQIVVDDQVKGDLVNALDEAEDAVYGQVGWEREIDFLKWSNEVKIDDDDYWAEAERVFEVLRHHPFYKGGREKMAKDDERTFKQAKEWEDIYALLRWYEAQEGGVTLDDGTKHKLVTAMKYYYEIEGDFAYRARTAELADERVMVRDEIIEGFEQSVEEVKQEMVKVIDWHQVNDRFILNTEPELSDWQIEFPVAYNYLLMDARIRSGLEKMQGEDEETYQLVTKLSDYYEQGSWKDASFEDRQRLMEAFKYWCEWVGDFTNHIEKGMSGEHRIDSDARGKMEELMKQLPGMEMGE